jgi:hypothetical protein
MDMDRATLREHLAEAERNIVKFFGVGCVAIFGSAVRIFFSA